MGPSSIQGLFAHRLSGCPFSTAKQPKASGWWLGRRWKHTRKRAEKQDATTPLENGDGHIEFKSDRTEETNGARCDHGCGPSGAQATAIKAVLKTITVEGVLRTPFI
jgi:hypothetical protein